jgi:hypothetical protein
MNKALYLRAPLELEPQAEDAPPGFSGVAYSGGVISEWGERFVVDLAQTTVPESMPLLYEHSRRDMIGTIEQAENDGSTLTIGGSLFSDIDDTAASIAAKAKRGARYQMSIGLFDSRIDELPAGSDPVEVNGEQLEGPLLMLRGGTVREVSVVALGADANTNAEFFSAGLARHLSSNEGNKMPDADDKTAKIEALEAKIEALTADLDQHKARADAAEAALNDTKLAARTSEVKALFDELGREFTEAAAAHYMALEDEAFAAISADLKQAKPRANEILFSEQATGDPTGKARTLSAESIYEKRRAS